MDQTLDIELKLHSLIYDEEMIKNFYRKVLGNFSNFEANFISIAARNKYLTEEERKNIRLGHTCMLGKTIVRKDDENIYLNKIKQLDASSNFYTDFDGKYLPNHCKVIYININPASVTKAAYAFKKILSDYDAEAFQIAISKDPSRFDNLLNRYGKLYNNLLTCYQTQRSRKRWIDIDCDISENVNRIELFNTIKSFCEGNIKFNDVHPVGILTHGGLHILINTDGLKDNPQKIVDEAIKFVRDLGENYKEIIINKNEMIPLPGTLQNGFKVKFIV